MPFNIYIFQQQETISISIYLSHSLSFYIDSLPNPADEDSGK